MTTRGRIDCSRRQTLRLLGAGGLGTLAMAIPSGRANAALVSMRIGVHGTSVEVEHPERLEQATPATAASRPIRLGFHSHFIGRQGTDNWFHFAIPSPLTAETRMATVRAVQLGFRTRNDGVFVDRIDFWTGHQFISTTGAL